jgi:hypothetical protein
MRKCIHFLRSHSLVSHRLFDIRKFVFNFFKSRFAVFQKRCALFNFFKPFFDVHFFLRIKPFYDLLEFLQRIIEICIVFFIFHLTIISVIFFAFVFFASALYTLYIDIYLTIENHDIKFIPFFDIRNTPDHLPFSKQKTIS